MVRQVLIVDDEAPARDRLIRLLDDLEEWAVMAEAENGQQALQLCQEHRPDVVLLDIRMPGMDGIETAEHLNTMDNPPAVIFTTAYNEYAIDAFDAQAIGYLMKPVRLARLERALKHAARLSPPQLEAIAQSDPRPKENICARLGNELTLIPISDVFFFQSDQKYTRVVYTDGEVLIDDSLKTLEDRLGEQVIRIHRNTLVTKHQLTALDKNPDGTYAAKLKDYPDMLGVSRRLVSSIRKTLRAS